MKRRFLAFPPEILQHVGLLIAFVLLMAASGFTAIHPVLTSLVVFAFSLPYLVLSIASRRAGFLYAGLLLGAVSYFLSCHSLGAPVASFPVFSVPLVVGLLLVGHHLRKKLSGEMVSFPTTVFRAMNITIGVFSMLALWQVSDLIGQQGLMRYVAGIAFLSYAGLYLAHCTSGASAIFVYVFSFFLTLGGIFATAALFSSNLCWLTTIASAGVILSAGIRFHRDRKYAWSRHFFLSAAVVIVVSLGLSLLRWPFLLLDLALASLLLWSAYVWFSNILPDVRGATVSERVVAKCFFIGSLLFSVLLIPVILAWPADPYVACAALICGMTFSSMAWQRRDEAMGTRNVYVLAMGMFVSAGLLGIGRQLPGWYATGWSLIVPPALLLGLGLMYALLRKTNMRIVRKGIAQAAVFPTFFGVFIPLLQGELVVALVVATVGAGIVAVLAARLKDKSYGYSLGSTIAGIVIAVALISTDQGVTAWIICAAAAIGAGACFIWADARDRQITRGAAALGWLILSGGSVVIATATGAVHLLYCVAAVASVATLMTGLSKRQARREVFRVCIQCVTVVATIATIAIGPFTDVGATVAGIILLILSAAHWVAWWRCRSIWSVRVASALLPLGSLLLIFGEHPTAHTRLVLGAGVVLVLFLLATVMRKRFPGASRSNLQAGHLTSIALACAVLIQTWHLTTWSVVLATIPFLALYAFMPGLRKGFGFRLGSMLWLTTGALFALATHAGTPYWQQMLPVSLLSLVWLLAGYTLERIRTTAWRVPLYVCGAATAGLCGLISVFTPSVSNSWGIFLVNGLVFSSLFLILKQDVFVYLLTLSLSLLAYDWIKASTTFFTQDVLFYLIIGAAMLGVFFALPHLKKLLTRTGTLPIFSIFTWRGELLVAAAILIMGLLVLSAYSLKLTGHPKFCLSCHHMENYYESWQHSSHKNVACIECHYEPGIKATVQGKLEGLVQVVKYISHSYSNKPHAMISNNSCQREGCHVEMERKDTLLFHGRIKFRHRKHLSEHPRGKELNCVSCHGQTIKGKHISVTETTCLTCHFYGRNENPVAMGQCQTCHVLPEQAITFMGESFEHGKFLKGKKAVRCEHCHSQVTQGDGAVSTTRCRNCHLDKKITVEDQEQFHLIHISKGHFDCLQCHDEIKHGVRPMEQHLLASSNCGTCHTGQRHSIQESIYAGTAIPQIEVMPDAMYKAGVACDGCHTTVQLAGTGAMSFTKKLSGPKQCADCHGNSRYGEMLTAWQEDVRDRLNELSPVMEELEKALRSSPATSEQITEARKLLDSARTKLSYIANDGSYGAHNFPYVTEVLDSAEEGLEKCRSLVAESNKATGGSY